MTTELLYRAAAAELSGDGKTVEGLAFRWDHPSLVADLTGPRYREAFERGSTTRTLAHRRSARPLFVEHQHVAGSVGETTFSPAAEGLAFRARLYDGEIADVARVRLHAGELPAVSVGFRALQSARRVDADGPLIVRQEIALEELSLARIGQHDGAEVLAIRSASGTPRLDALRRRRALLLNV